MEDFTDSSSITLSSQQQEKLQKAKDYLLGGYEEIGNIVPSTAGLCCYLGVGKSTVHDWAKDTPENRLNPLKVEFSDTLEAIQTKQEMILINGGLSQQFSGVITKLMLTNHGYSDKVQTDVTSNGESINKPTTIKLVAPNVSSED